MSTLSYLLALTLAASLLGACTSDSESSQTTGAPARLETDYTAFRASLKECTAQTGYDPEQQQSLGPYDLGAGELPWRDCAYTALRRIVVPNTAQPELYLALIEKDKELTLGIQAKRVTREQRRDQIADQREQIIDREHASDRMRTAEADLEERQRQDLLMRSTRVLVIRPPVR